MANARIAAVLYDHKQSADAPLMSAEWEDREHRYAAIGKRM